MVIPPKLLLTVSFIDRLKKEKNPWHISPGLFAAKLANVI
jgi:hypothetical protein